MPTDDLLADRSATGLSILSRGKAPAFGHEQVLPASVNPDDETAMTRTEWLYKFRRINNADTLEKVYEHLIYTGDPAEEFVMTQAYDHRKAELVAGSLFDRVPQHMWHFVK